MKQIDAVVKKETGYIAAWTLVLSALMQAVFLVIGKWDVTVLFGNLLSGTAAVLNFFLMGLTVQRALQKEEKEAKTFVKVSQTYRFLFLVAVLAVGLLVSCFHRWSVVIPVFFPRIAIAARPLFDKKRS